MLWIKALHIVFIASWFAGLFYLPRIFVNLAMVPPGSLAERQRLLLMARKLYRFMTPLGVHRAGAGPVAVAGLRHRPGAGQRLDARQAADRGAADRLPPWCRRLLARFEQDQERHGHVWFRWFNEAPVLMLLATVILVVVKPF
jgi:putative membrane protein